MKVRFRESGGVIGMVKGCDLDSTDFAQDAAEKFEMLVQASGISRSDEVLSDSARDLKQYEIAIEDGNRKTTVIYDDSSIPQSAKSLLRFLKKHSTPSPPD
jgi:hypothetical protein